MGETQICPWCQMEIVWDEETGPEDECPYCLNELKDYRTVTFRLEDMDEDRLTAGEIAQALDALLPEQEEDLDCEQCQDRMIAAGKIRLDKNRFEPIVRPGLPQLLKDRVDLTMLVCPSCFQVKTVLSHDSRKHFVHAIRETGQVN
jgi:hypothetical protein